MIGNAHIDPVWLWQWPEGYQEVRATFQSAVDRLDEYPDFVFTCDSSLFFAWVEESDPALFERIRERVAEGRLQVDRRLVDRARLQHPERRVVRAAGALRTALPAREVRHHRDDGREPRLVRAQRDDPADPRARAACDSYVFLRPGPKEKRARQRRSSGGSRRTARACSPTGSRTSTARRRTTSASTSSKAIATLPPSARRVRRLLRRRQPRRRADDREPRADRSGSTSAATCRASSSSSLRRFFDRVAANGELPTRPRRAAAPRAAAATRRTPASSAGTAARRTCCCAPRSGARSPTRSARSAYPLDELTRGLEARCSSTSSTTRSPAPRSSPPTRTRATSSATRRRSPRAPSTRAVQSIARQIEIEPEEEMRPVVVFNPHPWPLRADVEVEYTWLREEGAHVVDDEGDGGADAADAAADDDERRARHGSCSRSSVPPLGYRTYRVRQGAVERRAARRDRHAARERAPAARARPGDAAASRGSCSRRRASTSPRPAREHAVVIDDRSDTWGHGVARLRRRGRRVRVRVGAAARDRARCGRSLRVESRYGSLDAARGLRRSAPTRRTSTCASRSTGASS